MAHSIELLPDEAADARIRAEWSALVEAGLPSGARVRSDTNRPHVTLIPAARISAGADNALSPCAQRLPLTCEIGAPLVFGHGARHTLARLVVPSAELLSLHAQATRLTDDFIDGDGGRFPHAAPGAWTPHITLGRRLTSTQIASALDTIEALRPMPNLATFVALRRWNSDTRTEHVLAGRNC